MPLIFPIALSQLVKTLRRLTDPSLSTLSEKDRAALSASFYVP